VTSGIGYTVWWLLGVARRAGLANSPSPSSRGGGSHRRHISSELLTRVDNRRHPDPRRYRTDHIRTKALAENYATTTSAVKSCYRLKCIDFSIPRSSRCPGYQVIVLAGNGTVFSNIRHHDKIWWPVSSSSVINTTLFAVIRPVVAYDHRTATETTCPFQVYTPAPTECLATGISLDKCHRVLAGRCGYFFSDLLRPL